MISGSPTKVTKDLRFLFSNLDLPKFTASLDISFPSFLRWQCCFWNSQLWVGLCWWCFRVWRTLWCPKWVSSGQGCSGWRGSSQGYQDGECFWCILDRIERAIVAGDCKRSNFGPLGRFHLEWRGFQACLCVRTRWKRSPTKDHCAMFCAPDFFECYSSWALEYPFPCYFLVFQTCKLLAIHGWVGSVVRCRGHGRGWILDCRALWTCKAGKNIRELFFSLQSCGVFDDFFRLKASSLSRSGLIHVVLCVFFFCDRMKFFIPPPPRRPPLWFMKDEPIPAETTVVQLIGVHQDAKARIWKEVHLFKERRMVHVYGIRQGHCRRTLAFVLLRCNIDQTADMMKDGRDRVWSLGTVGHVQSSRCMNSIYLWTSSCLQGIWPSALSSVGIHQQCPLVYARASALAGWPTLTLGHVGTLWGRAHGDWFRLVIAVCFVISKPTANVEIAVNGDCALAEEVQLPLDMVLQSYTPVLFTDLTPIFPCSLQTHKAGGSSCDLANHDNSCTVSRTSIKGLLGFGGEVDGQADPLDDPEEMAAKCRKQVAWTSGIPE